MKVETKTGTYLIRRSSSIFTNRNQKEDVTVSKAGAWGARAADGKLYHTVIRLAAESGEVLRHYGSLPAEITHEWLRQSGFLENSNDHMV